PSDVEASHRLDGSPAQVGPRIHRAVGGKHLADVTRLPRSPPTLRLAFCGFLFLARRRAVPASEARNAHEPARCPIAPLDRPSIANGGSRARRPDRTCWTWESPWARGALPARACRSSL